MTCGMYGYLKLAICLLEISVDITTLRVLHALPSIYAIRKYIHTFQSNLSFEATRCEGRDAIKTSYMMLVA